MQSLLGSVLDIASDRAVEQVMWFVLADPSAAAPDSAVRHALARGDGMSLEGMRFIRGSERTPSLPYPITECYRLRRALIYLRALLVLWAIDVGLSRE